MDFEKLNIELIQYTELEDGDEKATSLMIFNQWQREEVFEFISTTLFEGTVFTIDQETEKAITLVGANGERLLLVDAEIVEGVLDGVPTEETEEDDDWAETRYIHVNADGKYLVCSFDEPNPSLIHPSFKKAMKISPNYIAYANKGDTLIFDDMTIEIKENRKHNFTDDAMIESYFNEKQSAEDSFKEWIKLLDSMDNSQRIRFLGMVYNDRFNAGKPIDVDDLNNY